MSSQPVPPSFKDLGRAANDLLSKDYPISGTNLEVKTKAPNNVVFKVAGIKDGKSGIIAGDLEAKYLLPKYGLTFTPTWSTNNLVKAQIELDNKIAKGLKLDFATNVNPVTSDKGAALTATYKQPGLHTRTLVDLFRGPAFTLDAVVGRDGFLVGGDVTYDVQKASISRYNAVVGYSAPEYAVTLHGLSNLSTFHASYYHKVNRDVEAGAKAIYDTKSINKDITLEVGTRAYLDNASFIKAKINNSGILGLGYTQALRPGVKVSFGLALDTQQVGGNSEKASSSAHKVGASLTFES
ncbi:voltage-dependent anion-selective channel protein 3 [Phakopsora pachyrhizi]|uniref:Voltage-dependent anion-selective channel protein 3 n=1 Tax=Phakopsora pachyrhizi TaxID=170000 RepID=A0AAV0AZH8_PHAPC|nr:voltage-dependent anion-selective channel protein 3 [Phakopsora pachyrhizi]KAI8443246.1 voltage-dependent anion-selective channel protein 3 [Phakopsora pachyrhizi]CAH7673710.1 voltage-dependent anion-selective channel protein 3 [Phakopsora pachyrhizi]